MWWVTEGLDWLRTVVDKVQGVYSQTVDGSVVSKGSSTVPAGTPVQNQNAQSAVNTVLVVGAVLAVGYVAFKFIKPRRSYGRRKWAW